jgi:hypothetical protein
MRTSTKGLERAGLEVLGQAVPEGRPGEAWTLVRDPRQPPSASGASDEARGHIKEKLMPRQVKCPTGLTVQVRGLKGKDLDGQVAKQDSDQMLRDCIVAIDDPGPYKAPIDWDLVLEVDRDVIMLNVAGLSLGDRLPFRWPCDNPSTGGCADPVRWAVEIPQIPITPTPEETLVQLRAGENRHGITFSDGRRCWFRALDGVTARRARESARGRPKERVTATLVARIIEVEGVAPTGLMAYLGELDNPDLVALREKAAEVEGGLVTELDVQCSGCRWWTAATIPFDRAMQPRLKEGPRRQIG